MYTGGDNTRFLGMRLIDSSHSNSGVGSPKTWGGRKFWGAKVYDFRGITLFYLEKCPSKHKMTIFSKNVGGMAPLAPPWLRLCIATLFREYSRAAVKLLSIDRSAVTQGLRTIALVYIFQTLTADIKECLGHP